MSRQGTTRKYRPCASEWARGFRFGVYRRLIAKEPSYVFCVSFIVIDRKAMGELGASKTFRLANRSQVAEGKEQTTDGRQAKNGT